MIMTPTMMLVCTLAVGVATAVSQAVDGQIAGRITDTGGAALPGVRITVTSGNESRQTVTGPDGWFVLRKAGTGTYRVAAELAGFTPATGEITLSPSSPRAFLAWRLGLGCLTDDEDLRIVLGARKSAPIVDAILHVRVTSADGPVLMSVRPECDGRVLQQYSVRVLGSTPGRGRTDSGPRTIFMSAGNARLEPDREYLALLWPGGRATGDLIFPVIAGRVVSSEAGDLNGMAVDEALRLLATWSQERQR